MRESAEILKLRTDASYKVDAAYKSVKNQMEKRLFGKDGTFEWDGYVDGLMGRLQNYRQAQMGAVLKAAYQYALKQGDREVRTVGITNERTEVAVENAWGDLWRKASEKTKSAFQSIGAWVKKAIRQALPKKKEGEPLTAKEINAVHEITEDIVAKLKKQEKINIQDEITRALAAGKLDSYESAGITTVMAQIETVKDNRRCKKCAELDGVVMPIERARELLPLHRNCRCYWKLPPQSILQKVPKSGAGKGSGVTKKIKLEQRGQERKAMKLRERLDRAYKQKPVTKKTKSRAVRNEECCHDESPWELFQSDDSHVFYYMAEPMVGCSVGEYLLVLKQIKLTKRKTACRILDRGNLLSCTAPALSFGHVLQFEGFDPVQKEAVFALRTNLSDEWGRAAWAEGVSNTSEAFVPLLPESMNDYPYALATNVDSSITAVMLNPHRGCVSIFGKYPAMMDWEELITFCIKAKLCLTI